MRGKILGADGSGGMISGEDSRRYKFELAQWRSERPPAPGEDVDFGVGTDGRAEDIYPLRRSAGSDVGGAVGARLAAAETALNNANVGDTAVRIRAALATQPQLVLSILLLLFACAFTWVSLLSSGGEQISKSMVGFVDYAGTIEGTLATSVARTEAIAQQARDASIGGEAGIAATSAAERASFGLSLLKLAPVLYLLPVGVLLILFTAYRKRRFRVLELAVGLIALLTYPFLRLLREALADAVAGSVPFSLVDQATARAAITLGWAAWLVPLCGVGLILTALGLLRRTPGL